MVNEPFLLSAFVLKASQSEVQPNFFSLHFDYESSHLFVIFPTLFLVYYWADLGRSVPKLCMYWTTFFTSQYFSKNVHKPVHLLNHFFSRISFHIPIFFKKCSQNCSTLAKINLHCYLFLSKGWRPAVGWPLYIVPFLRQMHFVIFSAKHFERKGRWLTPLAP